MSDSNKSCARWGFAFLAFGIYGLTRPHPHPGNVTAVVIGVILLYAAASDA